MNMESATGFGTNETQSPLFYGEMPDSQDINRFRTDQYIHFARTKGGYQKGRDLNDEELRWAEASRKRYIASIMPSDNPEVYGYISDLLQSVTEPSMNDVVWFYGLREEEGDSRIAGTTGPEVWSAGMEKLRVGSMSSPPFEPSSTEHPLGGLNEDGNGADKDVLNDEAPVIESEILMKAKLKTLRDAYAALSIQGRDKTLKQTKKARELRDQIAAAGAAYHAQASLILTTKIREWKDSGDSMTDVHYKATRGVLDEHDAFSQTERFIISNDDSRRGRFVEFLARRKLNMFGTSAVTGVGTGLASGLARKGFLAGAVGAGVLSAGIAIPVALATTYAIRSTRSILFAKVSNKVDQLRNFEHRYLQDRARITSSLQNISSFQESEEKLASMQNRVLLRAIGSRIEKDRRSNFRRVLGASAVGGAVAAFTEITVLSHGFGTLNGHAIVGSGQHIPGKPSTRPGTPPHPGGGSGGKPSGSGSGKGGGPGGTKDGGGSAPKPQPPPQPRPLPTPKPEKGVVDGFQTNVIVENGNGYQKELIDLLQQKQINLSNTDSWKLYLHLQHEFPKGNFFTNYASYKMCDGYFGISRPGAAHWNPAVINNMNNWLHHNIESETAIKNAVKAARKAGNTALLAKLSW